MAVTGHMTVFSECSTSKGMLIGATTSLRGPTRLDQGEPKPHMLCLVAYHAEELQYHAEDGVGPQPWSHSQGL